MTMQGGKQVDFWLRNCHVLEYLMFNADADFDTVEATLFSPVAFPLHCLSICFSHRCFKWVALKAQIAAGFPR